MAKDVEDHKTPDLLGGSDLVVSAVIEQAHEDAHLAAEHQLVAVRAYIKDVASAKDKSANTLRQAKHAQKLRAAGLVKTHIPAEVASEIKSVGSFSTWLEAQKAQAVAPVIEKIVEVPGPERIVEVPGPIRIEYREVPGLERVVEVEKIVEVRVPSTERGLYFRALGKRVDSLVGWRRALVMRLIGK